MLFDANKDGLVVTMGHSHRGVVVVVGAGNEVVVIENKDVLGMTVLVHVSERRVGAVADLFLCYVQFPDTFHVGIRAGVFVEHFVVLLERDPCDHTADSTKWSSAP